MFMWRIFVVFLFVGCLISVSGQVGDLDPRKVDVSSLTDSQIRRMMAEIESRGMSETDAIALARARGMSQQQIDLLKERMLDLQSKSEDSEDLFEEVDTVLDFEFSEKEEIPVSIEESSLFGLHLFNSKNLTFEPSVNIPVSSSYVLGGGDEIIIDVWGASQQSYQLEVDKNGNVFIPNIGQVAVGGKTLGSVQKLLRNKLNLIYRDLSSTTPRTFSSINLGNLKGIKVSVVGEVFLSGTYSLPGAASAFNALYLSGGPNMNGSFREIKVIRNNRVFKIIDVYDFLINGNSASNVALRDGDVILVPTYRKRVKVGGEAKRTGIFEVKGDEKVADLIAYAGGFTENAYQHRVDLYRNTTRQKEFLDVSFEEFSDVVLQSGDSIFVGEIIDRVTNRVSIEGAVYRPGNYELTEGLCLKELIEKAEGLREDAFTSRGLIMRTNSDLSFSNLAFDVSKVIVGNERIELQREDVVTISSIHDIREYRNVHIYGEVQSPGAVDYQDNMSLSDLVLYAGGFKESASESFIEVTRKLTYEEAAEISDKTAHVYQFNLSRDLKLSEEDAAFKLKPFDQVFIRKAPGYVGRSLIKLTGEVVFAGEYSLASKKERISDLILRAGGVTPNGFPQGAMLTRRVVVSQKILRLREELMKKDTTLVFDDMDFEVVGIDLKSILEHPGSKDDIFLKAGDELIVPREMQTIKISGEVLNPLSTSFVKGKTLPYYVDQGGGFSIDAKKRKVYVVYPNGSAASTKGWLFKRYPKVVEGAEVIVPSKLAREPMSSAAWVAVASSLSSIALTVATIVNLNK